MADTCIYCEGGFIDCGDNPSCGANKSHADLISGGWKHKGCFCVGTVGGVVQLVDCGAEHDLMLAIYTKGNEVRVTPVAFCP